jgi:hypothetical protein
MLGRGQTRSLKNGGYMKDMNRRKFFGQLLQLSGALAAMPMLLRSTVAQAEESRGSKAKAGGAALTMVDPKDPVAAAVKYVEDAKKAADSKGNKCSTCGFYAKKEVRNGKEVGTCTIFQGKLVYADGFCNSWNKKQA